MLKVTIPVSTPREYIEADIEVGFIGADPEFIVFTG